MKKCIAFVRTLTYNMGKRKGSDDMAAKSANLYARIEPDVKEQAEGILATLGIPASNANAFCEYIRYNISLPIEIVIRDGRKLRRYKEMEPMYLSIQQKETGKQIKKLLMENGYTVKDVQNAMGFENPQAIYKWISGRSLPSLDNFVILSRLLHTSIEDILVVGGDVVRLWGII